MERDDESTESAFAGLSRLMAKARTLFSPRKLRNQRQNVCMSYPRPVAFLILCFWLSAVARVVRGEGKARLLVPGAVHLLPERHSPTRRSPQEKGLLVIARFVAALSAVMAGALDFHRHPHGCAIQVENVTCADSLKLPA
jgi:hypothetical protein